MEQAFAYLRVSGKAQIGGDGFPRQLAAVRSFAKEHGIKIERVFEERGVSGATDLENRPALSELMEALHSNGVRLVLIEQLNRLARDLMVQETIIGDLRKGGFELISVVEPDLLQNDPTRKLMRQFMGAIAEYEKSMLVIKLRCARQRMKAKTGVCEGRKAFGFHPSELKVIERMRELRAAGVSFDGIAAKLNADGVRPRKSERWWDSTVRNVLRRA